MDDDYCNVIVVDVAVDVISHQILCCACRATGHYICDIPLITFVVYFEIMNLKISYELRTGTYYRDIDNIRSDFTKAMNRPDAVHITILCT